MNPRTFESPEKRLLTIDDYRQHCRYRFCENVEEWLMSLINELPSDNLYNYIKSMENASEFLVEYEEWKAKLIFIQFDLPAFLIPDLVNIVLEYYLDPASQYDPIEPKKKPISKNSKKRKIL